MNISLVDLTWACLMVSFTVSLALVVWARNGF
uniref:Cytochrome b6-f complex subunit 8 n=1 Tax=Cyanidium caldarium TaxID=2771 RepID=PETN_CYACA|nr:cytochrome b6/f complex subunit VIII [Cyanidium caldarium]Q9TLR6.1 RecName: Full=Cytochrome b6-f complex subunit 8; AltName: Full=Cytochrome b6-f complex subunit PetN; AltName: Full=Cytochrome b6-f complex subunit VIII [Cyanidium caldarium]AAF12891.1 unknown [Cyanidium caldarium]WDB00137.1 cytochrome b6/f complex subunit VIII [Cyanidium caldarium]